MENNQELFKQAILDARALRDTALVQAKTALAEHFEPTIKSMMRKQLSEDTQEEGTYNEYYGLDDTASNHGHNLVEEEINIDELLAELDEMTKGWVVSVGEHQHFYGKTKKAALEKVVSRTLPLKTLIKSR